MRKLLLLIALLVPSLTWAGTCGSGYSFSIAVRLHKASGSDQTNFAAPINFRDIRLATVANGGNIQNTVSNSLSRTVPADLVFCPDQTLTSTPLKYETEYYGATYGDYTGWVQTPTLTFASNAIVYLYANNVSVVTDQEDLTMWPDLNYVAVWHHPNGSTLDLKDSSGNAFDGTMQGTVGAVLGGFNGASGTYSNSNYVKVTSSSTFKQTTNVTWEGWVRPLGGNYDKVLSIDYRANGSWSSPYCVCLELDGNTLHVGWHLVGAGAEKLASSTGSLFTQEWTHIAGTYDGTTGKAWLAGVQDGSIAFGTGIDYGTSANLTIGNRSQYTPDEPWQRYLDELRIRNATSTTDYIATEAALSPYTSTFQFGTQTALSSVSQFLSCGNSNAASTCAMPFDITSGGVLVAMVTTVDNDCSGLSMPNDSLGNVYTRQVASAYTGTLHHYYICIYTSPITVTGTDTVTSPNPGGSANVGMTVYEVKGISVSGIQVTHTSETTPPSAMSLTSGQANTFLICGTRSAPVVRDVSEAAYTFYAGPTSSGDDHPAWNMIAYGVTGAGAQTCTFGSGVGAVMAMFAPAPPTSAVRHRVVNE